MKIKNIKIKTEGNFIKVSATCQIRFVGTDEVYLKFDKKYKDFMKLDASPFAAMLLVASMKKGEDLIIEGEISEKLYEGLQKIVDKFAGWNIGFKAIKIKANKLTKDTKKGKFEGVFFSGGVDSFYTFLKHKKTVTHLILANGYDIDLRNKKLWEETVGSARKVAKTQGVEIIEVESNIEKLLEPILAWNFCFGGNLAAIGLLLRNGLSKVYIASSFKEEQQLPGEGSHSEVDKNWGSESLEVVHDGAEATRFEKIEKIANEQVVLDYVRVCYLNVKGGVYNCGVCDKCLRTMTSLEIVEKLKDSKTFPAKLDLNLLRNLKIEHEIAAIFHKENLDALKKRGNNKPLEEALTYLLNNFKPEKPPLSEGIISKVIYFDHMYLRGTAYGAFSKVNARF